MKRWHFIVTIVLILSIPRFIWILHSEKTLNIAVIDKTVPKTDYREHAGLFWLLTKNKIVDENGKSYHIDVDYYGYDPYEKSGDTTFQTEYPLDLIYVTDTYGVYLDDLEELPDGEYSKMIYGGITFTEWNKIMSNKSEHTTLIVEFNTFASPTDSFTSQVIQQNIGLTWSGWTGRYFPDLSVQEIPQWLIDYYEEVNEKTWDLEGHGMVFIHQNGTILLLESEDINGPVNFLLTEIGKKIYSHVINTDYIYWFDINEPNSESVVEAKFNLNVTSNGEEKLKEFGIPITFPAIIHNNSKRTYYFSGDFADYKNYDWAKWAGYKYAKKYWPLLPTREAFYWRTYVPIMESILEGLEHEVELHE
jgi:hypothetical protein